MTRHELVDYIHSVSDFPEERVKAVLVQYGWHLEDIENAFIQVRREHSVAKAARAENARIAGLTASFILIVLLLASAPGASVTGNIVYSDIPSDVVKEVVIHEEIISAPVENRQTTDFNCKHFK